MPVDGLTVQAQYGTARFARAGRSAPMLVPTLGVIAGIVLDSYLAVPVFWHYLFLVGGAAQFGIGRERMGPRKAGLFLAGLACGMALHGSAFGRAGADHLVALCSGEPIPIRVRGVVAGSVRHGRSPEGAFRGGRPVEFHTDLELECEAVLTAAGWHRLRGLLPARVRGLLRGIHTGDRIEAYGRFTPSRPATNPGQRDWALAHRRQGVFARLWCGHTEAVRVVEPDARRGWVGWLRSRVHALLVPEIRSLDDEGTSLAEAMVLGRRSQVSRALNAAFARTGTSHYLSASGLHVGILASFVWLVSAWLGVQRVWRAGAVLVVVILYAVLAEPRVPIFRAAILTAMYCVSVFLHRSVHTLNWLSVSALVILVFRPTELFSAGFQLSFVVVLGIVYLTPQLTSAMGGLRSERSRTVARLRVSPPRSQPRRVAGGTGKWMGYSVAVSVAAWVSALLPLAFHFGQIPPWGWFSSLLLMPLALGVMIFGFVRILASAIWPMLGVWLGPGLDGLTSALAGTVRWMAEWPGATVSVGAPSVLLTAAAVGAVIYLIHLTGAAARGESRRVGLWRCNVVLLIGVILVTLLNPVPVRPDGLVVEVLDVGAGSATVIRLPNNRTMVYDAGSQNLVDVGRSVLVPALLHEGIGKVDCAIISHANADHFNGFPTVASSMRIGAVLLSEYPVLRGAGHGSAGALIDWLKESGIPVRTLSAGDELDLGEGVRGEVLWPPPVSYGLRLSPNDSSLVLRLEYGGVSVLLCGDIERVAQQHLIDRGGLGSDVLILPHHGSVVANTEAFIEAVSPSVLVCSSGRAVGIGGGALGGLIGDREYYNTAEAGAIRVRIGDGTVTAGPILKGAGQGRRSE